MEDDDVLMENDPLAKYLLNEKIQDFEIFQTEQNMQTTVLEVKHKKKIMRCEEDMQAYFENILKSELLLEEDYNVLETSYMYSYVPVSNSFIYKISLSSCITAVGIGLFKYTNSSIVRKILPLCSIPLTINIYNYAKKKIKNRRVASVLAELQNLTSSIKKCLRIVSELSATIGYYSSATVNTSSFNSVHIRFAKEFYALLLNVIKLLANNSSEIMQAVPLTIDNYMKYDLNDELVLKSSVNNSDLKFLFELYMLVQSDFIKTLGLSFCTYLWALPHCDINKVLTKIIPNTLENLRVNVKTLNNEYAFLRNYGVHSKSDTMRSPVKFNKSPLNYMHSCLHNAELHFQQLFCKTRDLQSQLNKMESEHKDVETNQIIVSLNEIDKQIVSSKNMIDAVAKYFNQLQKKDEDSEISIPAQQPSVDNAVITVVNSEEELKPDKLVYELYIPKEGLDLTELEVDSERPVFSLKELDYSGVMLDELRTILRARNPEMFQEEVTNKPEINSDSENEDSLYKSRRRDVFRPTQPIGLAENLQSISQVLAARKAMMKSEELFDDSYSNSDADDDNGYL